MEKIVEQGILYDFYGSLLTRHQQTVYEQLVYNDMSLNEIAEVQQISKQAVHDLIRRTTAQMKDYEDKLHMVERFRTIRSQCEQIQEAAAGNETIIALAEQIKQEL
ncbi:MAG: DNA-binding protein [Lachnospiraceae bacterium]|nr:DNA-binding protein [Lachnospiraceae bacterium]